MKGEVHRNGSELRVSILVTAWKYGKLAKSRLLTYAGMNRRQMRYVDALLSEGLLRQEFGENRALSFHISLTPKGLEFLKSWNGDGK